MGISISREKAIKYVNQSYPKAFKERLKTLAIFYFVLLFSLAGHYILFKNTAVIYCELGAATIGLLVFLLFSLLKRDKQWYNTYFNMAILGFCLSLLCLIFGLSFFLVFATPVRIYGIGFSAWLVIALLMLSVELKRLEKKDNFNPKKPSGFLVIASSVPGIAALAFYRTIKDLEYSHIILACVFAICFILISFLILPGSRNIIRYYLIRKHNIQLDELKFS
ncbi:MAG: hypothetical protein IJJ41_05695 [Clostridia bacterium]|nr:hypothetical protein [Clostridia bacterium]MBR0415512.1 hypothetical protein [Clostridia bacterium]